MASLYPPRPVLTSQKFTPSPDYVEARRSLNGGKLPHREPTGNTQSQSLHGVVSRYQSPVALSPSMQHGIHAAIVPSQSLDSLYRLQTPRPHPRYQRRARSPVNPLYYWPAFRQYRNRQAHKDTQKDKGGVWRRPELEDAFVDAVLLMPHMGRRKFSMSGKLHGRNMLISEYIFVICVDVLGNKEIFRIANSNDSIEQMGRKQVSSHMQVVKKFFEDLRCFHFLFPSEEKKEPGSTNSDDYYDEEEQESFKANPVLAALAEGKVPEVKPNYEYFSQLLSLQFWISARPKTCEIFVSSSQIQIRDEVAYDAGDAPLDHASFPHLNKYMNCEDTPNVLGKDVLLHEYTRSIDRTTSACAKSVTRRWQKDAPAMYETMDLPSRDEDCLLIEMCATLELHELAKFPTGSELTGFVEVGITQPSLQGHRWKCVTRITRPPELHSEGSKQGVYSNESGIHRRGCSDGRSDCDCHARPRQDIPVPFPAVEWASILSMAVEYPDVEHQRLKEKRSKHADGDRKRPDLDRTSSKRKRSEDEGDAAAWSRRAATGSDLICKVAMYQELWSCAPDSSQYTRQAIIFWRFNTTNQWYKYNPVFKPAGTTWRWLTINDPMSRYHQQKALVYPSTSVSRDSVMSPTPTINQHLTAVMSETFSSAWDHGANMAHVPPASASHNGIGVFDSFSGGLATPPPSASIQGSYSSNGSFDSAIPSTNGVSTEVASYLASLDAGSVDTEATLVHCPPFFNGHHASFADMKPSAPAVNPYAPMTTSLDLSSQVAYDNADCDSSAPFHGWDMALDTWPGAAGSCVTHAGAEAEWHQTNPKLGNVDHSNMWNPVHWGPVSAATNGTREPGGSPRELKRRRTEGVDSHLPVSAGW